MPITLLRNFNQCLRVGQLLPSAVICGQCEDTIAPIGARNATTKSTKFCFGGMNPLHSFRTDGLYNFSLVISLAQIHNPKIDFSCLKYVDVRLLDCKMPYKFHFMAEGLFGFAKIMILHAFATNFDGFQL